MANKLELVFYRSSEIPELLFKNEENAKNFDKLAKSYITSEVTRKEYLEFSKDGLNNAFITGDTIEEDSENFNNLVGSLSGVDYIFDICDLRPDINGDSYRYLLLYLKRNIK